jgi:putative transposase
MWQTDFTYLKIIGWGWPYLSTILDGFSHYVIAWELCPGMTSRDVTETLEIAMQASNLEKPNPKRPSRNGVCTINGTPRNMKMMSKTLA